MKEIVLFASGTGTNAESIIRHFKKNGKARVITVFSNNENAAVLERAKLLAIPTIVFSNEGFSSGDILKKLQHLQPDLIVLAGFLLKFPLEIIEAYPNKIVNIHPALLPKYGGKGMYGMKVHKTIFENNENETGISIHYVDEHYDNGDIIFQQAVSVTDCNSPEQISEKVRQMEHRYFPEIIEKVLEIQIDGAETGRIIIRN